MTHELTALLAVCDLVTPWQRYEQLRKQEWVAGEALAQAQQFGGTAYFTVQEFATRMDGAAISLRECREWGSQSNSPDPSSQWKYLSVDSMTRQVLNVVIPDDAEESGEDHPWTEFVEALRAAHVSVSEAELRQLPYHVIFAPRLHDILVGAADGVEIPLEDLTHIRRTER